MESFERHTRFMHRLTGGFFAIFGGVLVAGSILLSLGKKTETLHLEGSFVPLDAVTIRAPRKGRILQVEVESGTWVEAGDTLFVMDRTSLELPLLKAEGRLGEVRARISSVSAMIEALASAHNHLLQEAARALERSELRLFQFVQEKCIERGLASTDSILHRPAPSITSLASYRLREVELASARAHMEALRADTVELARRRAELLTLKAELEDLTTELSYYRRLRDESVIRAPRAGYVVGRELSDMQGSLVEEGMRLCRIGPCRRWQLRCKSPGQKVALLRPDMQAVVLVRPSSGGFPWQWQGRVSFVASEPTPPDGRSPRQIENPLYTVIVDLRQGLPKEKRKELVTGRRGETRIILGSKRLYSYLTEYFLRM